MDRVTILCSDPVHPVNAWLDRWMAEVADRAEVTLVRDVAEVAEGDFLFLIACHQIVKQDVRDRFAYTLVVHGSRLPKGRGWSPLVWQVLEGENELPLALIDAGEGVDTGDIWRIDTIALDGTELNDEIQGRIAEATTGLMHWALANCRTARARAQEGEPSYYPRRRPADSEVKPEQSISEIFDLLRIADPQRYPAWFEMRGQRYTLAIAKAEDL
ncbi:formyltransferase family protein [Sphingomonas sp. KR3-1]|uniref:formyltransferase family protein n=1 Tax=Sphingomonas sp. KR3-1 TaxID=3156611 RepID=UPI0032B4E29C